MIKSMASERSPLKEANLMRANGKMIDNMGKVLLKVRTEFKDKENGPKVDMLNGWERSLRLREVIYDFFQNFLDNFKIRKY